MTENQYRVVLEPLSEQDGGGFVAIVPDLPGCMSDGETDVEALANAHDAIQAWIAEEREMGRPVPRPQPQRRFA